MVSNNPKWHGRVQASNYSPKKNLAMPHGLEEFQVTFYSGMCVNYISRAHVDACERPEKGYAERAVAVEHLTAM